MTTYYLLNMKNNRQERRIYLSFFSIEKVPSYVCVEGAPPNIRRGKENLSPISIFCFWIFFLQGSSLPSCLYPDLSLLRGPEPADILLDGQLWGGGSESPLTKWHPFLCHHCQILLEVTIGHQGQLGYYKRQSGVERRNQLFESKQTPKCMSSGRSCWYTPSRSWRKLGA